MTEYRLVAEPRADFDVAAAYRWYESEQTGLGREFLEELRNAYDRIAAEPFQYQAFQSGIRRALIRRFPYAVYFAVEPRGAPCESQPSRVATATDLTEWTPRGSSSTLESLTAWLTDAGVLASFLLNEQLPGTVRISTIHSAKGLDSAHVLIFGAHELEGRGDEEARRLLYIAMTRAREELCVSYHGDSPLMEELGQLVG